MNALIPGMLCGFLLGVFNSSVLIAVCPLTILVTPRELIGRVMLSLSRESLRTSQIMRIVDDGTAA
jgi:hypothetical protein